MATFEDFLTGSTKVFEYIDVADQECKAVGEEDMFLYLIPKGPLRDARIDIYRLHVKELLARRGTYLLLSAPTKAEVLMHLSHVTVERDLKPNLEDLFFSLLHELVPEMAEELGIPHRELDEGDLMEVQMQVVTDRPMKEL